MHQPSRTQILVLPPPSLYRKLFSPSTDARLRGLGDVTFNTQEADLTSNDLLDRVANVDVLVTGWRSPAITDAVIAAAPRLRLVAHSAGSIKFLVPERALRDGRFAVTTVAAAMGPAVAEMALQVTLMCLRPIHQLDAGLKSGGDWKELKARGSGEDLAAQRVGVIGAGHTGRHYIRMMRGLGVETWVYDPYLTEERAASMDVERVTSLDALVSSCRVVALHAPSTPQTRHMIGRRELAQMRDGAVLVNTARSSLIDTQALLDELRSGRISAALDVFDEEPLPPDSALRTLPNVILTPHVASHTRNTHLRQGELTVDEVERFVRGQPLRYAVTPDMLSTMA